MTAGGGAGEWIAACDRDGIVAYLLKPAAVVGTDVEATAAGQPVGVGGADPTDATSDAGAGGSGAGGSGANGGADIDGDGGATSSTGQWEVTVTFTATGQEKFTALTEATIGRQVAILLDGVVISAPQVLSRIPGDALISGTFTRPEAEKLAAVIQSGALPVALSASEPKPTLPPGFS
jgi:preprotein translocase subunit SecD